MPACLSHVQYTFVILGIFNFLLTFKPSEPFLVRYLGEYFHISNADIMDHVFPWWTYSQLVWTVLLTLSAELAGYKLTVVLSSFISLTAPILVCFLGWNRPSLILSQCTSSLGTDSVFILLALFYRHIPVAQYQMATAFNRLIPLAAVVLSSVIGQVLVTSYNTRMTFYVTIATQCAAAVSSLFLPNDASFLHDGVVRSGAAVEQALDTTALLRSATTIPSSSSKLSQSVHRLKAEVRHIRSDPILSTWIVWGAVIVFVHALVLTYWQNLFRAIDPAQTYNGWVNTAAYGTACGSLLVMFVVSGYCYRHAASPPRNPMGRSAFLFMVFISVILAAFLLLLAVSTAVILAGVWFVLYQTVFETMLPFRNAQVGGRMASFTARYAAVFGVSLLITLVLQVIAQAILQTVTDTPLIMFISFTGIYVAVAVAVALVGLVLCVKQATNPTAAAISDARRRTNSKTHSRNLLGEHEQQQQQQVDDDEEEENRLRHLASPLSTCNVSVNAQYRAIDEE